MKISVIIPIYKDAEGLRDTLNSLQKQTLSKELFEVIVANDGAIESINDVCKEFQVRCIDLHPNKGSYGARNAALALAKGAFIAFIDADIEASTNWLETGLDLLAEYDYIGGTVLINKEKLKTVGNYFEYLTAFSNSRKFDTYHYAPTANLFVKKSVIDEVGKFDERLRSGGDFEFGNRVHDFGRYKMFHSDDLVVIHPPRNSAQIVKKFVRTYKGRINLKNLYPDRFGSLDNGFLKYLKFLCSPLLQVLRSKKKIPLLKYLEVLLFSVKLGVVNFIISIRIDLCR